jgi:imidazolonepropionase-like amidohydrolase
MSKYKFHALIIALAVLFSCLQNVPPEVDAQRQSNAKSYQFINGQWFDGKDFRRHTFYSVNGLLTRKKPARVDEVVDLKNGYVVPPFADVHCHHFDGTSTIDQQINLYLKAGVFYAKVQGDLRSGALAVAEKVNRPQSVDVSYAHGVLTHTYGHGVQIHEGLALFSKVGPFDAEQIKKIRESHLRENDAYYLLDTSEDLERKWSKILEGKPDFIKILLLHSEEFEEQKKRTDKVGHIGLDPSLVPLIVSKAHAAGLHVSAHVDTVTDYRIALKAGVDEMAHLPGYYVGLDEDQRKYELTEEDVKETARRGVWVDIAPVAIDIYNEDPVVKAKLFERIDEVKIHNLKLLKRFDAKIAFGSDWYGRTPINDVLYIQKLGVFSNLEVLKIWCEETPRNIFPNRKLGLLKDGYEANFIVLEGNPLMHFEQIKNIRLRFKQGYSLDAPK